MISMSSLVMTACLVRLKVRVSLSIISAEGKPEKSINVKHKWLSTEHELQTNHEDVKSDDIPLKKLKIYTLSDQPNKKRTGGDAGAAETETQHVSCCTVDTDHKLAPCVPVKSLKVGWYSGLSEQTAES